MKDRLLKCAVWFVGMIRRASVASGIVYRAADEAKRLIRPNKITSALPALHSPAIELLLVGFDPTINVALNIVF